MLLGSITGVVESAVSAEMWVPLECVGNAAAKKREQRVSYSMFTYKGI